MAGQIIYLKWPQLANELKILCKKDLIILFKYSYIFQGKISQCNTVQRTIGIVSFFLEKNTSQFILYVRTNATDRNLKCFFLISYSY